MNALDNRLLGPLAHELRPLQVGDWGPLLSKWRQSAAGQSLLAAVDARVQAGAVVYPRQVFRALALTPRAQVRVVILGQDPYHGAGQAEGLAFSVPDGQRCPPSLRNIFKELQRDLGLVPTPGRTSLAPWAQQGVLLLNTSLTVEEGRAASHSQIGWQALAEEIVKDLSLGDSSRVFLLWGAHAQAQWPLAASEERHLVLRCNHPSPLSALRGPAPFVGCGHFGRVNQWLLSRGGPCIDWRLAPA